MGLGRDAAEKTLRRIFETRAKTAALKTEEVQIRFIRPDVALAHVTNELTGLVTADGQNLPSHRELSLRVFVKDDGVWRLASFQNTMLNPFPGAPQPHPSRDAEDSPRNPNCRLRVLPRGMARGRARAAPHRKRHGRSWSCRGRPGPDRLHSRSTCSRAALWGVMVSWDASADPSDL
jgi:hypothetical protein